MQTFAGDARRFVHWMTIGALTGLMLCLGCERTKTTEEPADKAAEESMEEGAQAEGKETAEDVVRAIAQMKPTEGNDVSGVVYFDPNSEGVVVRATIMGLEPGSVHGFHIHEKGDCSAPDATSAGGHYAPEGHPHGLPPSEQRHAGDMGNIVADDEGAAKVERTFDTFSLEGKTSVLDRAVIVHAQEDKGTQPTGEAGARVACGVITKRAEGVIETHTESGSD